MNLERQPGKPYVAEPELTIYHAEAAKDHLIQALEESDALALDLSGVSEIDTAGIQILVLARREAERTGKPLSITAASGAVREVVDFYNLASYLGLPPAAQSGAA